jgi:hypothetical protein
VAIEDAPATISMNRDDLDKQREAKRKKEKMIKKRVWTKQKRALSRHLITGRCSTPRYVGEGSRVLLQRCWVD